MFCQVPQGKPRKRVSNSYKEGLSITPSKLRYVQFHLNRNIVVCSNHKKEPLCSYCNWLVISSMHSFQHVSSASKFQNPLPLILRNNLADFIFGSTQGVLKRTSVNHNSSFHGMYLHPTNKVGSLKFSFLGRIMWITKPRQNAIIRIPQDEMTK